jgi:hypothetical protein
MKTSDAKGQRQPEPMAPEVLEGEVKTIEEAKERFRRERAALRSSIEAVASSLEHRAQRSDKSR